MSDFLSTFEKLTNFKKNFFNVLAETPWADSEFVSRNLEEYGALSIPVAEVYFETSFEDGSLVVKSHLNQKISLFEEHLLKIFQLFNLNFSDFCVRLDDVSTSFHDTFYHGSLGLDGESGNPCLLQKLMDSFMEDFYRNGRGTYTGSDYTILIGVRLDNVFCSAPLKPSVECKLYDNDYFHDFGPCWSPTQPFGSQVYLIDLFDKFVAKAYGTRLCLNRIQPDPTDAPGTAYISKSSEWVCNRDTSYTTRLPHISDMLTFCL